MAASDPELEIGTIFAEVQSSGARSAVKNFSKVLDRFVKKNVNGASTALSEEALSVVFDCVDRVLAAQGTKHPFGRFFSFIAESAAITRPKLLLDPLLRVSESE
jgi:hypothetical protein